VAGAFSSAFSSAFDVGGDPVEQSDPGRVVCLAGVDRSVVNFSGADLSVVDLAGADRSVLNLTSSVACEDH
jgi:hypothetical protein